MQWKETFRGTELKGVGILDMVVPLLVNKLLQSIAELDNWIETHPPSPEERLWYEKLRKKLLLAQEARMIDDLEYMTKIITRMIVDSGPLDKDFLPSFQDLLGKLDKLSK